jgi:hypothetical protein
MMEGWSDPRLTNTCVMPAYQLVSDGIPRDFGCRLYLPEGLEKGEGGGIELLRPHVWDDLVLQGVKGRH